MVVPIENHNVIPVLDRHSLRGWNATVIVGVGVGETGRQSKENGRTKGGLPGRSNSTEATTRPSRLPAQDPTPFVTLVLAPKSVSSLLRSSESTQRIYTSSPTISSRRTQSSATVQRSITAQNTNLVVPISTPTFTMFAVSGRTSIVLQRSASSTAALSRPIPTPVTPLAQPGIVPAAQDTKPFPGRNQSKPTLDAAAVVSFLQPIVAQSSPVSIASQPLPSLQTNLASTSLTSTTLASTVLSTATQTSSIAPFSLSSIATLSTFSFPTSFITLTKSQLGKEQASNVPSVPSASEPLPGTPSVSTLLASTLLATSTGAVPTAPRITLTAANGQSQRGGRLTPLARNLFIVLGALGQ
jgi:hypothetical protein